VAIFHRAVLRVNDCNLLELDYVRVDWRVKWNLAVTR